MSSTMLTAEDVLRLAGLRDPVGVLSVYVDVEPAGSVSAEPSAVELRKHLRELDGRGRTEGPRERWTALRERLDGLAPELEKLCDPRASGRGRCLFAPLSGAEVCTVKLRMPLQNRVVLEEAAYVRPLVGALDRGGPAGLITVSRSGIRVCEAAFGEAAVLRARELEVETADWREYRGPADPNPGRGRSTVSQRDAFGKRRAVHLSTLIAREGESIRGLASDRAWQAVAVAGDPRLTRPLEDALSPSGIDLVAVARELEWLPPHELLDALGPELEQAYQRRLLRLVATARDAAATGGAGTTGLRSTLEALADARVSHLLFDDRLDHMGLRAPDGRLFAPGAAPAAPPGAEPVTEPRLAERMIERAFETGAEVTPLTGEAADALAGCDGVAAHLRW